MESKLEIAKNTDRQKFLNSLENYMTDLDAQPFCALLIDNKNGKVQVFKKHRQDPKELAKMFREAAKLLENGIQVFDNIPTNLTLKT